ncbi:MAG: transcription antitermination factor NusB, partial [Cyclobacteriaceae bacterium]
YAYRQCKFSNYNLAQDYIREAFLPDLNTMESQDKPQLKKDAERCIHLFSKYIHEEDLVDSEAEMGKIKDTAVKGVDLYHRYNRKDQDFLRKNMVSAVENIPELYLYAINILLGFGDHVRNEQQRKRILKNQQIIPAQGTYNLASNKILEIIRANHSFKKECTKFKVDLGELELEIKEWFRDWVRNNEDYQRYIQIGAPDLDQDKEILQFITKKVIFKSEGILSFFQDKDLNWYENKSIVRSLALKVLKSIDGMESEEALILPDLAINWEEDKEFFQNIFNLTIDSDREFDGLIANKTKNWDIERIALTDKVIMTMALTEMVNFPSIPVKVTINEYIDISKTYSTPKSKQFVNGLLDALSKELTESGEIRKSGRGLIDNK